MTDSRSTDKREKKPTPRTDAAVVKGIIYRDGWRSTEATRDSEWVPADHARQLERELAAANQRAHYEATWHNHYAMRQAEPSSVAPQDKVKRLLEIMECADLDEAIMQAEFDVKESLAAAALIKKAAGMAENEWPSAHDRRLYLALEAHLCDKMARASPSAISELAAIGDAHRLAAGRAAKESALRQALVDYIEALFVSGNNVPVQRAWINDDTWAIIKECLADGTPLVHHVIEAESVWRRSKDRIEATGDTIRRESPLENLRREYVESRRATVMTEVKAAIAARVDEALRGTVGK